MNELVRHKTAGRLASATELTRRPTLGEVVREEFWIVAKSFFAPVYGPFVVLEHLLKKTERVDQETLRNVAEEKIKEPGLASHGDTCDYP